MNKNKLAKIIRKAYKVEKEALDDTIKRQKGEE